MSKLKISLLLNWRQGYQCFDYHYCCCCHLEHHWQKNHMGLSPFWHLRTCRWKYMFHYICFITAWKPIAVYLYNCKWTWNYSCSSTSFAHTFNWNTWFKSILVLTYYRTELIIPPNTIVGHSNQVFPSKLIVTSIFINKCIVSSFHNLRRSDSPNRVTNVVTWPSWRCSL